MVDPAEMARDLASHDDQGNGADRQVDVENPAPGQVVDEHAPEQRADDAGHAEDGAEQADVTAPFPGGDDITDDGLGAHHQATTTEALNGPEKDQFHH